MSGSATAAGVSRLGSATLYAALVVGLGHWLGGGAALGRLDAALLIPTLSLASLAILLLPGRFRPASAGAAVLLPTTFLTILAWLVLDGSRPSQWLPLASLALTSLILLAFLLALGRGAANWPAALRAAIIVLAAAAWWLAAHVALGAAYTQRWAPQPGKTIVVTGLPLRTWPTDGMQPGIFTEAAAIVALRQRAARPLVLADGLAAGSLGPADRLLLAHPRALPPETLVEVDRFVRAGGRAVILADGLSAWPPPYPLGDPRNPPVTSLLTPLLDHWGLRLDAPVPGGAGEAEVRVNNLGWRLALHSSGHFAAVPEYCRGAGKLPDGRSTIAICRIGRGSAVVLADADMLFDPLWRPEPLWAAHLRRADNIEWLAEQVNQAPLTSRWGFRPTWR